MSSTWTRRLRAELLTHPPERACCRRAEAATVCQLAEPGDEFTMTRLDLLLGVDAHGAGLTKRLGLLDGTGRRLAGLPPRLAAGTSSCCSAAVARGAVLAACSIYPRGTTLYLSLSCPGVEIAVAVAGALRRLSISTQLHPDGDGERIRVNDYAALLHTIGAGIMLSAWHANNPPAPQPQGGRPGLHRANVRRAQTAAATSVARTAAALDLLGEHAPTDLRAAGLLRLRHREVNLTAFGALSDPPLSKDTINGRLRRLHHLAEQHQQATGDSTPTPGAGPATILVSTGLAATVT